MGGVIVGMSQPHLLVYVCISMRDELIIINSLLNTNWIVSSSKQITALCLQW